MAKTAKGKATVAKTEIIEAEVITPKTGKPPKRMAKAETISTGDTNMIGELHGVGKGLSWPESLGALLKVATRRRIGEVAGVPRNTMDSWCRGESAPASWRNRGRLQRAFGWTDLELPRSASREKPLAHRCRFREIVPRVNGMPVGYPTIGDEQWKEILDAYGLCLHRHTEPNTPINGPATPESERRMMGHIWRIEHGTKEHEDDADYLTHKNARVLHNHKKCDTLTLERRTVA